MGDSDDEYDRRRGRDKFRRERSDYQDRNTLSRREDWPPERGDLGGSGSGPSGGGGGGGNWSLQRDRFSGGRRDYRDNYGGGGGRMYGRNDRYSGGDRSGGMSPPSKRLRGGRADWDGDRYPNYDLGGVHSSSHHGHHRDSWSYDRDRDDDLSQPPMMTLKQFVNEQDDNLDGETLIQKYNDYKAEFKKIQIQEFFNRHKDEEWFRCKYFPDEIEKQKEKNKETNEKRRKAFMELFESNFLENVSLDIDKGDQILRVLDAAVIKLEGGTEFDLKALDENLDEQKNKDSVFAVDPSANTVKSESSSEIAKETANNTESGAPVKEKSSESTEDNPKEQVKMEDGEASSTPIQTNEDSADGELMEEGEDPDNNKKTPEDSVMSEEPSEPKPRPLHRTCSIFFRNIPPSVTRQEVEDECRKFPGFLRLAIAEPQMDRRFNRRGWATFERTVNIREICWALNSVKIRGVELGPIVNRDLSRRIRSVNGISSHKTVVRADIRHAVKLIMKLDAQKKLWVENEKENGTAEAPNNGSLGVISPNPLLKNITDYLIEEAPAEEEELLGTNIDEPSATGEGGETNGNGVAASGTLMERDDELIKVLDRFLFYLRIVHSVDYYNHSEYPSEDEMPNRIGLVHARGLISSARVSPNEITDYLKEVETKLAPLQEATPEITPEEARKLGMKNIEEAEEAFIKENTKEVGEGKWLCPLSNKKFMGPEFVRKHILNKHMERVEQVRAETHYFNNYILDPKRPQLPEHPANRPVDRSAERHDRAHGGPGGSGGGGYGYNNQRSGGHHPLPPRYGPSAGPYHDSYRPGIKRRYHDLDAPVED